MVVVSVVKGIVSFFSEIPNAVAQLKDLIMHFFEFVIDCFSLIPAPFSQILGVAVTVIITIFIVKIVGAIL